MLKIDIYTSAKKDGALFCIMTNNNKPALNKE